MPFLSDQITLHLPFRAGDAEQLLKAVTHEGQLLPEKYQKETEFTQIIKFNGIVKSGKFQLSQKVKHGQHFLPLIKGRFIDSGKGCLVEVSFQLFFGSKILFHLWNVVSLLLSLVFYLKGDIYYGLFALGGFLINNMVAYYNFRMHVKKCKEILVDVFNI